MFERGIHMDAFYVQNESTQRTNYPFVKFINKPVMMYYFVDPFCEQCWSIDTIIKKMTMQYGALFNVRPIISNSFAAPNNRTVEQKRITQRSCKSLLSVGIKAAALQGNKAGRDFLRSIQDALFLYESKESVEEILFFAAEQANLDIHEFKKDLYSSSAKKAFQGDLRLIKEMDVKQ